MHPAYDTTRNHILDSGGRIIAIKGFSGVGLNEILQAAMVPKGSFYHYFRSKEQYGESLIARFFDRYLCEVDGLLSPSDVPAAQRLMRYWQRWLDNQASDDCERKCLVVKLSAEVADLSESMRLALCQGTDAVIRRLSDCIDAGRRDGSLSVSSDTDAVARQLYQQWLGASLLSKVQRNAQPLEQAMSMTCQMLSIRSG